MPALQRMRVTTLFLHETDGGDLVGYNLSSSSQLESEFNDWAVVELMKSKAADCVCQVSGMKL